MKIVNGDPELLVAVHVPDRLSRCLEDAPDGKRSLAAAVSSKLDQLLAALGIPGHTRVEVEIAPSRPAHEWMRLWVDGRSCRYSDELVARVAAIIDDRHVTPPPPALPSDWPEPTADKQPPWQRLIDLLTRLVVEAVKLQPAALLGEAQCLRIGELLRESGPDLPSALLDQTFLSQVLTNVLSVGISVADVGRIHEALGSLEGADPVDARELVIAALSTDFIDLVVPSRLKTQLGVGDQGDEDDLLAFAARGLFEETGIVFSPFRYASSADVPKGFFAFRVNHVLTTPCKCLEDNEILINEAAHVVPLVTDAKPTTNPATGRPAAIATLADKEALEQRGYTTWTASGYVILCLADVLRTRTACFVHQDKVQAQLDTLQTVTPAAVQAARARLSPSRLTALIRALAADRVSLCHLPVLLERVIETPYAELGMGRLAVLDDPVTALYGNPSTDDAAALEAFVRTGLRREIANRCTGGSGTLVAYLVDPSIEQLLRSPRATDDDVMVAAFRDETLLLPPTAQIPTVLTADDTRPTLQNLLALALPRLSVVGYGDLPADLNVQPIARVQLPEPETEREGPADAPLA